MRPFQLELGFIVTEADLRPLFRLVALLALLPEPAEMRLNLLVAIAALVGCVTVFVPFCIFKLRIIENFRLDQFPVVALGADDFPVCAFELKVTVPVVEGVRIEQDDIGIPAVVIGVAVSALRLVDGRVFAMKPPLVIDIGGDRFVAGETKVTLRFIVEQIVTAGAVPLKLGVPFDQRSRHNQLGNIG